MRTFEYLGVHDDIAEINRLAAKGWRIVATDPCSEIPSVTMERETTGEIPQKTEIEGAVYIDVEAVGLRVPQKFKVGDLVRLKSGGPSMTVESVKGDRVEATWFDEGMSRRINSFVVGSLVAA